jgi:hypothetical protein
MPGNASVSFFFFSCFIRICNAECSFRNSTDDDGVDERALAGLWPRPR